MPSCLPACVQRSAQTSKEGGEARRESPGEKETGGKAVGVFCARARFQHGGAAMPANEWQDRKARQQERIAKFLAKVSQLPDDMIAPDPESAAMLGMSEWTLRRIIRSPAVKFPNAGAVAALVMFAPWCGERTSPPETNRPPRGARRPGDFRQTVPTLK